MILKHYFNTIQVIKYQFQSKHNKKINSNKLNTNNLMLQNNKTVQIENLIFNLHGFVLQPIGFLDIQKATSF
jgi:hypothetical protein